MIITIYLLRKRLKIRRWTAWTTANKWCNNPRKKWDCLLILFEICRLKSNTNRIANRQKELRNPKVTLSTFLSSTTRIKKEKIKATDPIQLKHKKTTLITSS
jgi:hypothetical protein